MAYIASNPNEEENKEEQQPMLSGASSVINTAQFTPQATQPQKADSSGRFVNLQNYLSANKDQAKQMGDQVAGQIDTQAQKAQSKIGETQSIFNQKVQENSIGLNENLLNEAVSDSANFVKDAEKVNQFARMRDATYKGPSGLEDLEDYQGLQADFNKAQELLSSAENESGRQTLLNETFKRSDYTSGQNKLDQLLLQNDPNARSAFSNLQTKYSGLSGLLSGAQSSAAEQARLAKEATDATRQKIATTFGREDDPTTLVDERDGVLGQLQSDLENKLNTYRSNQQTLNSRLGAQAPTGELDADIISMFGLEPNRRLYDVNLQEFINPFNEASLNIQRVADKDDYAKYQALQQLINGGGNLLYDDSMAGTASSVGVDKDRLKSVLDNKDTLINNTYNNLRPHWELLQGRWPSSFTGINDQTNTEMRRLLNSIEEYGVGNNPQDIQAVQQIKNYLSLYDQLNPNRTVKQR